MFSTNDFFEVLFKLALPVFGLSFLMVWWALRKGMISETQGVRALSKEIDAMGKARKKDKKDNKKNKKDKKDMKKPARVNPVHDKWLKFGGGFYGIVALYTYGLIEWREISDFISNRGGIVEFFSDISINLLINIFINGLVNFIAAISWPVYWIAEFGAERIWIWGGIAYAGYWLGMRAAQHFMVRQANNEPVNGE